MHLYDKLFAEYDQTAAQVLLTKDNYLHHHQYSNSRNALQALIQMGAIPVVNENDAVSVDEVKIGDNDTLSAMTANLVDADLLIILSDIDGVYTANPQEDKAAELIAEIREITPAVEKLAGGAGSRFGTGGMGTKIQAAKIAMNSGVTMIIAPGGRDHVLRDIMQGENIGTIFPAKEEHLQARKSWLAFGKSIAGAVIVDDGCEKAMIEQGASILAAGIAAIDGEFAAGSTVRVLSLAHREIARGIVNYDSQALTRIIGHQTKDFAQLLPGKVYEEVIHRDNMVMMV
jgi:glutamate 5-kinase